MTASEVPKTWKGLRRSLVSSRYELIKLPLFAYYKRLEDETMDDLRGLSVPEQEMIFIDEIKILLMGCQTTNIHIDYNPSFSLIVNTTADPYVRDLVMHFERIISHCATIRKRCYQNLCESSRPSMTVRAVALICCDLMQKELGEVIESSSSCYHLLDLFHQIKPLESKLETAAQILEHIADGDLVGGEVLTLLATRIKQSVRVDTSALLHAMEQKALIVFHSKLYQWISQGTTDYDTILEFVVWNTSKFTPQQLNVLETTTSAPRDDRFELGEGYMVLEELCPSQFLAALPDIVKCGRYLHILRASSAEQERDASREIMKLLGPLDEFLLLSPIKASQRVTRARDAASSRILKLLRIKYAVGEAFEAVHSLFLGLDAAWLNLLFVEYNTQFLMPIESISEKRLSTVWLAINGCLKRYDSYLDQFGLSLEKESVLTRLFSTDNSSCRWLAQASARNDSRFICPPDNWIEDEYQTDAEMLCGWSALSLKFKCPSMLEPIFTKNQMCVYSNIFRLFLNCHLAIHRIGQCISLIPNMDSMYRQAAFLFNNINTTLHRFMEHSLHIVVFPLVAKFSDDLINARSIEEMATLHNDLLVRLGHGLRLGNPRFLKHIFALCTLVRQLLDDKLDIAIAAEQYEEIFCELSAASVDTGSGEELCNDMFMMTIGNS